MSVKPVFPYRAALLTVVLVGAASGYFAGRSAPSAAGRTDPAPPAGAAGVSPILANGGQTPPTHPAAELDAWLRIAERLAAADGLGFDPAWDAPGLLLSMEKLTAADFPPLLRELAGRADTAGRKRLEEWLVAEWSRRRPQEALAWAEEHRRELWNAALAELAKRNPAAAWEKLKTDPSRKLRRGEMEGVHSILFETWARQDRPAALRALGELTEGSKDGQSNEGIVAGEGFWK